jgi:2,4-dienoyl-CoA reductase-like NADH-dependent reductase (Old Yellow Enzyme family)
MQLWHVGRISDPEMLGGELPVAPSALAPSGDVKVLRPKRPYTVPRPLETAEIAGVVQDFARAAANAKAAGFDLVEVHAANGYLFDQFMHDGSNQRTDQYGGPVENRARLLMEVLDAMAQVWPAERIGVHLNLMSSSHDMRDSDPLALFSHVAQQLQDRRIGFLFAREALVKDEGQSWGQAVLPIGRHVRQIYTGCYIANEGFTRETGELVLAKGWADAVSYGRAYMANPDLPERFAKGAPLNELNQRTVYSSDATGYNDYPAMSE